ncbi:MAG: GGDEF domain-containing protein [Rhodospirillales bacterium]|nr:GGDEF domain-containing protein [Rhodospirillales bacterium]
MPKPPEGTLKPEIYRDVLDTIVDGVYFVDAERRIVLWNKGAEQISGYDTGDVLGHCCADNILCHIDGKGKALCEEGCPLAATLADGLPRTTDMYLHHKAGHRVSVEAKVSALRDVAGRIVGAVEVFSDNSVKMAALESVDRLIEESLIDPLTKVGNRRHIEITVRGRFEEMARYRWPFALVLCDIDRFKEINDAYGHAIGDEVLLMVSKTLQGAVRSFDFLGRWGGEEFLLCLPNVGDVEALTAITERFRALVAASSVRLDGQTLSVTASFGATLATREDNADSAFRRADALLYRSKEGGRNLTSVG